jgi:hypothetical protein
MIPWVGSWGELTLVPLQVRRSKRPAVSTVQQSEAAISLVHHITSHLQVKRNPFEEQLRFYKLSLFNE